MSRLEIRIECLCEKNNVSPPPLLWLHYSKVLNLWFFFFFLTFHTQLTFVTLGSGVLLGHSSVRKRTLGKPRWAGTHGSRNVCPCLLGSVPLGL